MRRRLFVTAALAAATAAALAACTPQFVAPSGPAPLRYRDDVFTDFTKTSDITYGSAVDARGRTLTLTLDAWAPKGDTVTKRPAIVWVHGGSFCCGDPATDSFNKTSPELVDQAQVFAHKGYFSVSINYRTEPGGCSAAGPTASCITAIQESLADAQTAVRWLRTNASTYGIDPNRIAIGGSSAGAITAMNVAYSGNDAGVPAGATVRAAMSFSGAHLFGKIDGNDPPVFLMHGTNDPLVPYQWAVNTVNDATAAGAKAYLTTWDGEGHTPYVPHRSEILQQEANFLYWALDLAHAAR
jgi:acetyl esterase/lipase